MTNRMKVEFDSISANEAFARVTVAAFLTQLNPSVEEVADVKTAVSEAVTNAIIHGYQGEVHTITIEGELEGDLLTLRVRDAGYRVAWTPYARLTHYESKSRGGDEKDPAKAARFASEQQRLYAIHGKEKILDDPYYNPSLTRDREDFSESDDLRKLKEGSLAVRWRE